ncbi:MAG: hypothetical protein PUB96_05045, partial [Helicobacteraceae bacterium]|nr:hypothetical protein [Helicobacteraceae bacterium]
DVKIKLDLKVKNPTFSNNTRIEINNYLQALQEAQAQAKQEIKLLSWNPTAITHKPTDLNPTPFNPTNPHKPQGEGGLLKGDGELSLRDDLSPKQSTLKQLENKQKGDSNPQSPSPVITRERSERSNPQFKEIAHNPTLNQIENTKQAQAELIQPTIKDSLKKARF